MDEQVRYLKIVLEYEGTWFHGFQKQGNLRTVQSVVEEAMSRVFGHGTKVVAAGRTDAGVHAKGQVISTKCEGSIPTARIKPAVNSMLPEDLAIVDVSEVDQNFDANRSVKSKSYRYYFVNEDTRSPFHSRYAYDVARPLDTDSMAKAALHYVGRHDFTSFRAAGSAVKTSTRSVHDSRLWVEQSFRRLICFEVTANGFLYNMVRIMAGTLLEVGAGRLSPDDVPRIIRQRDRSCAGPTVPARGLWLWEVRY